jgi:hypothetical protein
VNHQNDLEPDTIVTRFSPVQAGRQRTTDSRRRSATLKRAASSAAIRLTCRISDAGPMEAVLSSSRSVLIRICLLSWSVVAGVAISQVSAGLVPTFDRLSPRDYPSFGSPSGRGCTARRSRRNRGSCFSNAMLSGRNASIAANATITASVGVEAQFFNPVGLLFERTGPSRALGVTWPSRRKRIAEGRCSASACRNCEATGGKGHRRFLFRAY